ncbi:MAG: hypothetical protein ACJ73C_13530 [Nitrososphaeraceae archaeon]
MQVDLSIISRDVDHLRQEAKYNIKRYIDERLPEEYEKCRIGLNAITKEAWSTSQNTEDKKEKIQALPLAKECYSMKLDLLTNAAVVDDAIMFVSSNKFKDSLTSGDNHGIEREKSKEPDHDEDKDQSEEEQEEQTGEIITANQVF